jgi:parallel beta-helix repeat protein
LIYVLKDLEEGKLLKKIRSGTLLMLLLISIAALLFNIQPVRANDTIYIHADGSIDPVTANITRTDDVTYTFNGTNYDSLVIERSNIIVDGAGFALQAKSGNGIDISSQSNVTIKNLNIDAVAYGVYLYYSSNNTVFNCSIYLSATGVTVDHSSYNNIYGNNITRNDIGIDASSGMDYTTHNLIHDNMLASNNDYGISLGGSYNSAYWNNITDNEIGISVGGHSHNIYGNNVTRNTRQNGEGIVIVSYGNSNVSGNYVAENRYGIFLRPSTIYEPNILKGNVIANNTHLNFGITNYNTELAKYYDDVDSSNTVNGKPVYYWTDREDDMIPLDAGFVVLVNCVNVTVQNLTLENNLEGILLAYSHNCTISSNNITDNGDPVFNGGGIVLYRSSNNRIGKNSLTTNHYVGIILDTYSSNNSLSENNFTKNDLGVWFFWSNLNNFSMNNMENNLKGVLLDYSTNNTINNNDIIGPSDYGIKISAQFNNISANNIAYHKRGIELTWDNNVIVGNNIMENYETGVVLTGKNNLFFHNNFIDNAQHISVTSSPSIVNSWDNGYPPGGNYWTEYEDKYPNATELDNSGIWNTSYVINEYNIDHHPLMVPTEPVTRKFTAYDNLKVEICSNSSISAFQFNATSKKLCFNVTGPAETNGFCNVSIPQNLLWGDFSLLINGFPLVEGVNYTKTYNDTHYTFYITYTHSKHIIEIMGTAAIPEFPSAIIPPLLMVLSMVAVVFARRKLREKGKSKFQTPISLTNLAF